MFNKHFQFSDDRSKAFDLFRVVAIMCVVGTHIPYSVQSLATMNSFSGSVLSLFGADFGEVLVLFFKNGIGRVAAPGLGMVSAWFLMKSLERRSKLHIIKKRAANLLIPFFFWNIVAFVFYVLIYFLFGRDELDFSGRPIFLVVWDALFNPLEWPVNTTLHYLRDLFFIVSAYLCIHVFLERRFFLTVVLAVFSPVALIYFGASGHWLGDNMLSVLPRADLVFYFLLGIATYRVSDYIFSERVVAVLVHPLFTVVLLLLTFVVSRILVFYNNFIPLEPSLVNIGYFYITLLTRGISFLLLLSVTLSLYSRSKMSMPRKLAFRLFCAHSIVIYVVNGMINNVTGDHYPVLHYFLVLLVTIIVTVIGHFILERLRVLLNLKFVQYI